jgi:hypothetical protein
MPRQGPVVHGLPDLKLLGLFAGLGGDGFVNVRCHPQKINHPPTDFKRIRREDWVEGTGFEKREKPAKVESGEAG